MGRRIRVVTVVCILVGTALTAHAVVLCAKPRGDGTFSTTVKIRETCRTSETTLDPLTLGLASHESTSGGSSVVYKDANGVTVGPMSNSFQGCGMGGAIVQAGGTLVQFAVKTDGTLPQLPVPCVWFESADCSGQPLIQDAGCGPAFPPAGFIMEGTLYYPNGTALEPSPAINSALCANFGCQSASGNVGTPAASLDVSRFVPPFRLVVQ